MHNRAGFPVLIGCAIVAIASDLLIPIDSIRAENGCPNGYMPAKTPIESMSDCTAILDYYEPLEEPSPPEPVWESRWGAIAVGDTSTGGGFGVSSDMKSRSAAENAAIKQCTDTGGGKLCKAKTMSYHDQCAVVAWGEQAYVARSAATLDLASEVAMRQCGEQTSDCRIFYSGCSLPVRVR